jgi:hypothetical protein
MASSVSSERAFSSAGITISKRRNCLDTNIVEALQCLKSLPRQDLLLQDVPSVADEEARFNDDDKQHINQVRTASEVVEGQEDCTWEEVPPLAETHSDGGVDDDDD